MFSTILMREKLIQCTLQYSLLLALLRITCLFLVGHWTRSKVQLLDRGTGHDIEIEDVDRKTNGCARIRDLVD